MLRLFGVAALWQGGGVGDVRGAGCDGMPGCCRCGCYDLAALDNAVGC